MEIKKPMLCENMHPDTLKAFSDANNGNWICQDKIDGCRAIFYIDFGKVTIQGRENWITHRYPDLMDSFPKDRKMVIDAEICTKDEIFNHLQHREANNKPFKIEILKGIYPAKAFVFDILEFDGQDMTMLPFKQRYDILTKVLPENDSVTILKNHLDILGRFKWVQDNDKEGIILKDANASYHYGKRASCWVKVKHWKEAVVEFTKYEVNPAGITVENCQGTRCLVAGHNSEMVKSLIDANGKVKLEIQYLEMTKNNAYRMPTFKRVYQEDESK